MFSSFFLFKSDSYEILEKFQELRETQERMQEEFENIKYRQLSDIKEHVEKLESNVRNIRSTVDVIQNDVSEIIENQEKLFSLQNKIFQLLQQ